ncbi:L-aspartate oxidase [Planctomycetales bacterium 10988]|nr:L-aspartate oxidase [Planctomycetales bacterium 10988]
MIPRYLIPFNPKAVVHYYTDILVIGGGVAGLRSVLAVDPRLSTLMITKEGIYRSNSNYAQGGIAGVLDPEDRFEDHSEDTLKAGGTLCDRLVVDLVVKEAPHQIGQLIDWGTNFDREAGELALGREGGHSHRRIAHAFGDATGREMMRALVDRVRQVENLQIWEHTFTLDLLTYEGSCRGALVHHPKFGEVCIWAKQTLLCTGGAGQLYRETTNPDIATADGHAMAYRAGAELRDMEFVQFHPTVLYIAGSSRHLITEAVRGEGAYLRDRNGVRFMPEYDSRAELAPRDVVSQAIFNQMEKTQHSCVYLDLSHLDPNLARKRFPGIAKLLEKFNLDITKDRIPVRSGAHYMIGGLTVDTQGRTTLPGLWAAGEVSSTGLHGANRLASNSLLEALVYGAVAGQAASELALKLPDHFQAFPLEHREIFRDEEPLDLPDIRNSLRSLMGRNVGIRRTADRLQEATETVDYWSRYVLPRTFYDPTGWQLQNLLCVARLIIAAALAREETRGVHLRGDFPETDDTNWCRHLAFQRQSDLSPTYSELVR